jgi:putative transposase
MRARMTRQLRIESILPGAPHHLILRGNNRRKLFSYPADRVAFLRYLLRAARRHGVLVHVVVLMTNHVHLVVTTPSVPALAHFVKGVAQPYAQWRNAKYAQTGKLFEQRYYAGAITSDDQLMRTVPYAELNPRRAGICDDLGSFAWSTYSLHAFGTTKVPLLARIWTPCTWYEQLGSDAKARQASYRSCLEERWSLGDRDDDIVVRELEQVSEAIERVPRRPDGTRAAEPLGRYEASAGGRRRVRSRRSRDR